MRPFPVLLDIIKNNLLYRCLGCCIIITICPWKAGLCERRDMHQLLLGMLLKIYDINIVSLHQAWDFNFGLQDAGELAYYSEVKVQSSALDGQVDRFHQAPNSLW